eukprot:scaffold100174_cov60-Phaeocystis_antarctica.AAC.3
MRRRSRAHAFFDDAVWRGAGGARAARAALLVSMCWLDTTFALVLYRLLECVHSFLGFLSTAMET